MNTVSVTGKKPNLLVAEDEVEIADIIEAVAEDLGFQVQCVYEGAQVVSLVKKTAPDLIALDLRMPGADGVEIIRELAKINCRAKIVLMSGMDQRTLTSVQSLGKEQKLDIIATLAKPMTLDAIEKVFAAHKAVEPAVTEVPVAPLRPAVATYGLKCVFEPEVILQDELGTCQPRLSVNLQWRKDNGEVLSGPQLFDWAHKQGVGKGLADLMLREAFATWQLWATRNFRPEISLKLDDVLLKDLEVPDILAHLSDFYQVERDKLVIEVRQAAITASRNLVSDILSRLRIKGFKVSIALAGDGEEFIPMLDRLPVDDIVVDLQSLPEKSLVNSNMETEFIYSSLTSMARKKGLGVGAKNVNRTDLHQFVKQCGFTRVRGTVISSDLSAEDVMDFYASNSARQLDG